MVVDLPKCGRPLDVRYHQCELGVDLPSAFMHDLWSIDSHLYPIFHPYRILWDDLVNSYTGATQDERYPITENSHRVGELVMGHVLSNGQGVPTPDGSWHIWRWCEPARAWAHIIPVESKDRTYLRLLVERLWLQAKYNDRYGHRGYQKMMEEADVDQRQKIADDKNDLMGEIHKANSGMMKRIISNYERGVVDSTNPQKESVISYTGQTNKSRTVRPLEDREGGLILPDDM